MKIGLYPGSFNQFHVGHLDVLNKSLKVFDKVIIAIGMNLTKSPQNMSLVENNPFLS